MPNYYHIAIVVGFYLINVILLTVYMYIKEDEVTLEDMWFIVTIWWAIGWILMLFHFYAEHKHTAIFKKKKPLNDQVYTAKHHNKVY